MNEKNELIEYIVDLLSPIGDIQTAHMFGGTIFKHKGKQLGVLFSHTLYLKITDIELQKRYILEGSVQFSYTRKDKETPVAIKNWWSVPEYAMDNGDELVRLAEEIL